MFIFIPIIIFGITYSAVAQTTNKFEATLGCLQYNADQGYDHTHPYFPTSGFRHIKVTSEDVKTLRMGVLGENDGHVRLSPTMFPYNSTDMNEIVLSGWCNRKTAVRRYTRFSPEERGEEIVLKEQSSIRMLSLFRPFMFTMAVHPNGLVQLTKDKDTVPFLEFQDPELSVNYIGFVNWDVPVVYFYDCPLENETMACV